MKTTATTLVALLFSAGLASAGPDEAAKWLIGDAASMIDFGILRIDLALADGVNAPGGYASYDWDRNRFTVTGSTGLSDSAESAEKACADWVSSVRLTAFINDETGAPFFGENSSFATHFSHSGFERTAAPDGLYATIDRMIELRCYGSYRVDDASKTIEANAPLLGTGYSLKKN